MARSNTTIPGHRERVGADSAFSRYFPTVRLAWGCFVSASIWFWCQRRTFAQVMVAGTLAGVSLYGLWEYSVGTQRDAVAAINRAGGTVYYDWEWRDGCALPAGARPARPDWALQKLGPDFVGHVVAVDLDHCGLPVDDALLSQVGRLGHLEYLSLGYAEVNGLGLAHLRGLTRLKMLDLRRAQFSGPNLAYLAKMVELEDLGLPDLRVSDADLGHLARLTKLKRLYLSDARVTNAGLAPFASMRGMQAFTLRRTSVTSLEPIQNLAHLKHLNLVGSPIDDDVLRPAGAFQNLELLWLGQVRVTDLGLASISALPDLKVLAADRTLVGDAGLGLLCDFPESGPAFTRPGLESLRANLTHMQLFSDGFFLPIARSAP